MASRPQQTAFSPPARIPKLKYRNPLPPDSDATSLPSPTSSPHISLQVEGRPLSPDSEPSLTVCRPSFETTSVMSMNLTSAASMFSRNSSEESSTEPSMLKKKKNPVLGFFSLKEPSHAALEKFAKQQRQISSLRRASTPSAISTGTFANKQLPSNVPKVNSKWDGVPQVSKHRRGSSTSSTPKRKESVSSSQRHSLPPFSGPRIECESATPVSNITKHANGSAPDAWLESPTSSVDSLDVSVREAAEVILIKLHNPSAASSQGKNALTAQDLDKGGLESIPDSHEFLFTLSSLEGTSKIDSSTPLPLSPKSIQNFSRPISLNDPVAPISPSSTLRPTPSDTTLPTLYETPLVSTESLGITKYDDDSHSIAPSSIASSEMSRRWFKSPQERLGLGGRLRVQDAMPWEDSEGKPRKNRLSIFGIGVTKG